MTITILFDTKSTKTNPHRLIVFVEIDSSDIINRRPVAENKAEVVSHQIIKFGDDLRFFSSDHEFVIVDI